MKTNSLIEPLEARIAPAFASAIDLSALTGANGFKLPGLADNDKVGSAVSNAGDVNGDGIDDFIIGATGSDAGGADRGAAYVVFGKSSGLSSLPGLDELNGINGFVLTGAATDSGAGYSASSAGDVNNDGFDDIIVGAPYSNEGGTMRGAAYVVFGKATFDATISLGSLNGATGFKLRGFLDNGMAGGSVSGAGDVNGDGFDDSIVGSEFADGGGTEWGEAYVVFGKAGGFTPVMSLGSLNGSNGFRVVGFSDSEHVGKSVSGAGDINNDGYDDIILGAPYANAGGSLRGAAYVIFGKGEAFDPTISLFALDVEDGFQILGFEDTSIAGFSVSGAGDMNGDGYDDVIVGVPFSSIAGNASGAAYVIYGKGSSFGDAIILNALDSLSGFRIAGASAFDHAGVTVRGAGDINGDGLADVIVGAIDANPNGVNTGAAYVVFGSAGAHGANVNLSQLNGFNGFALEGVSSADQTGLSVSGAGDVNGDGFGDVIVGAPQANEGGADRGAAYIVYGQPDVSLKFASGGKSATFIDSDGDVVTVRVTKGSLSTQDFTFAFGTWQGLHLGDDGEEFAGTNITVSVKKSPNGNGFVNLGAIHAEGIDLGTVRLPGDLGQIDAGDGFSKTPGVKSLTLRSLGMFGGSTQPSDTIEPLRSDIVGSLGALTIASNMKGAVCVTGGTDAKIGSVKIGGNLDGTFGGTFAGLLRAGGNIGAVTIKGNVIGGADYSGIIAGGKLGKVTIEGDLKSAMATEPVFITALGDELANTPAKAVAIAGISIGGDVLNARILAGYTASIGAANPDASIGAVVVGGNWAASSMAAGVADTGIAGYGIGDTLTTGDIKPNIIAKIASVLIKGTATGSAGGVDNFGITAQHVAKLQIGQTKIPLTNAAESILLDPVNNDFRVRDFAI